MSKRIITILISAAIIISAAAFTGCDKKTDGGASSAAGSEGTNSSVFEVDSSTAGEDSESKAESNDEKKESDSDKKDDKKNDSSKESSSKSSSKVSSKASSKASSKKSTDKDTEIDSDKALEIVLANTDYTEEELVSIDENDEYGEEFYNISFYRNGTYVFYVRKSDGKFFTYEDYNEKYNEYYSKPSAEIDKDEALEIVLANTDYSEDELTSINENEDDGDKFYNISFYRNGTYVFYVRQKDGKFYDSDDFNKAYNEFYDGYVGHD